MGKDCCNHEHMDSPSCCENKEEGCGCGDGCGCSEPMKPEEQLAKLKEYELALKEELKAVNEAIGKLEKK